MAKVHELTSLSLVLLFSIAIYIAIDKDSSDTALPDLANATIAPACAICFGSQVSYLFVDLESCAPH